MGHVSIRRNSQTIMENQMNYPVEAEDIIDAVPQVKDTIFAVYNQGFIDGIKEGRRALKNNKFEVIRNLEDHVQMLLDRNAVLSEMYNNSLSSKESK